MKYYITHPFTQQAADERGVPLMYFAGLNARVPWTDNFRRRKTWHNRAAAVQEFVTFERTVGETFDMREVYVHEDEGRP